MIQANVRYSPTESLDSQLHKLLITEVEALSTQSFIDLARVAMGHFLFQPESMKKEVQKMEEQETALLKWLQAAIDDKRLNIDNIDYAYTQLHNMLKGHCFWPQIGQYEEILDAKQQARLVSDTVTMFISLYSVN